MLRKGTKRIFFIAFLFIMHGCTHSPKGNSNANEATLSNLYVKNNFYLYQSIYKDLNDSIIIYKASQLLDFLNIYKNYWIIDSIEYLQIDSMICINSKNDRLVATINITTGACKDCKMDQVSTILGKKINDKWYFFMGGGHLAIPRDIYGKSEMNPLSFHELSQIARKNMLEGALIKNEKGEYIVNDKWVDGHFYNNGMCAHCKTKEQYDSTHWYKIIHKWKEKIDTNEYKPLHRNKMNSPAI